mgnify:CR=1 FL=1
MSKVVTFSRVFPATHPKAGQPTGFIEKIFRGIYKDKPSMFFDAKLGDIWLDPHLSGVKLHTIRAGNRWKVGDKFSPRVWSGKPYCSPQITIAPDIEIKQIWDFECKADGTFYLNGFWVDVTSCDIPKNDGLTIDDFLNWFPVNKPFTGQVLCWDQNLKY